MLSGTTSHQQLCLCYTLSTYNCVTSDSGFLLHFQNAPIFLSAIKERQLAIGELIRNVSYVMLSS